MRILMLDNEFPPLGGGTGVVNYHLLEELKSFQDIQVDLVTSSRTRNRFEEENFSERIKIYKVPVDNQNIHHSSNVELIRYSIRGYRLAVRLHRNTGYDLSMAFAGVPAGFISYLMKLRFGLPYLVSLQGPDVPGFEARYRRLYPFLKPLLRSIWGQATYVTAISEVHRTLALKTFPGLQIPIIPNGVDLKRFSGKFKQERAHDHPLTILCVGRLIERKGQHHLIEAFAAVQLRRPELAERSRLVLVGTGDALDHLQKLAEEVAIADRVIFRGVVDRKDMPEIYGDADLFVLPSFNEGMSIALLEAMASSLPVIVTDTGGTRELVRDGENGLVIPWANVEALSEALIRLLEDLELRVQMSRASRLQAQTFTWSAFADQHLRLFRQMLVADAKPPAEVYT